MMKYQSVSAGIVLLIASNAAFSLPFLQGTIDITGISTVLDDGGSPASPTGIDWGDLDASLAGDQGLIVAASGDFASLQTSPITTATLTDFNLSSMPVSPLWAATDGLTDFSFTLTSVNVDIFILGQAVKLSGTGIVSATGFDDTFATWDYTSQSGLSFSSNTHTVPEPAVVALLGLGLIGIRLASRRRPQG